jgi:hypothetical protein
MARTDTHCLPLEIDMSRFDNLVRNSVRNLTLLLLALAGMTANAEEATPALTPMPEALEVRFALSAVPPLLRDRATVYVLDTAKGYRIARQGNSGIACLVERTQWEFAEFRDDLFVPLCYDAAGMPYLQAIMDTAALRAQGLAADALKARLEPRFRDGTYVPRKAGLSYMVAPVMRTIGPPDMRMHTMAMPHLMFYAPGLTNADIDAKPDLADPASLRWPFIDRQGIDEHSYIIQMIGEAEKARILADEQSLVEDLCAHRTVLCLGQQHGH